MNVKFSIGSKLVIIIFVVVMASFGSIYGLVNNLVYQNILATAEDNNLKINRRSAMEAESAVNNIKANTRVLLHSVPSKEAVDFFFSENTHIAAVYYKEQVYANRLNKDKAESYFNDQKFAIRQSEGGETIMLNAAPFFDSPYIALFFPGGAVLFSSDSLNNNFGLSANQSFMINSKGDILAISDYQILKKGISIAGERFVYDIVSGKDRSGQSLLEADLSLLQDSAVTDNLWIKTKRTIDTASRKITGLINNNKNTEIHPKYFLAYTKLNIADAVVITNIEYDKVFEGLDAAAMRSIYLTVIILLVCITGIWLFSKTVSVPLVKFAKEANKIENGNFDIDIKIKRNDEIGLLSGSFVKMCRSLNIFSSFLNKDIAVKAMQGDIKPGGYPKHATIFFSDIIGFKAKLEQITQVYGSGAPDKIVNWINPYFEIMINCIEKTNGAADKYIGDAVMAHWGTAQSDGSPRKDAFNCIKAALMMRKELFYLNSERDEYDQGNPSIRIGCGINTGLVTAGQLGSEKRKEFTVLGEPVFTAAGIEALAEPLGADILISEETWRLVGDKFITEEMPPVSIEGKKNPVRVFAVINFQGEEKGPQTLAEVREILGIKIKDAENIEEIEELNDLEEI